MDINKIIKNYRFIVPIASVLIGFAICLSWLFFHEGSRDVICDAEKGSCTYIGVSLGDIIFDIATNGKHIANKHKSPKNTFLISDIKAIRCAVKTEYVNKKRRYTSGRHHRSNSYTRERVTKYIAQIETYTNKKYQLKVCSKEQECFNITNKVAENIKNGYKYAYSSNQKY